MREKVLRPLRELMELKRALARAGTSIGAATVEDLKLLAAEPGLARIRALERVASLRDVELRVFSQFGDDGIIHWLAHRLALPVDTFVEFGVADYKEANTRLLLLRDNWRGLVMDSSPENVATIRADRLHWRHDLTVQPAFVSRENVNELIRAAGFSGRIGLLHIDIDGNDYWIWEALDAVDPDVVVLEYNAVLGFDRPVTVPYDPAFRRDLAHPSWLLFGASLPALDQLARRKGYVHIGTNGAGNNAYFVKRALAGGLPQPSAADGARSRFRESRGTNGELTFLGGAARRAAIADATVVDVSTGERMRVGRGQ